MCPDRPDRDAGRGRTGKRNRWGTAAAGTGTYLSCRTAGGSGTGCYASQTPYVGRRGTTVTYCVG